MSDNYRQQLKKYRSALERSKTAFTPGVEPTEKDIELESKIMSTQKRIKREEGEKLKADWYDDDDKKRKKDESSYLEGVLHTLGAPTYAIAGGVENLLGKGTKSGLANIKANIEEEGTFGDILRNYNINNAVAMPLGFAMDIAFDPLNWMTAGTAALIPRVVKGATKGGLTGAKLGLKSGLLSKAETTARFIPGVSRRAFKLGSEDVVSRSVRELSRRSVSETLKYEQAVGNIFAEQIDKSFGAVRAFEKLDKELAKSPTGRKVLDLFKYDPQGNIIKTLDQPKGELANFGGRDAMSMLVDDVVDRSFIDDASDAIDVIKNPHLGIADDSYETLYKMKGEAVNEERVKQQFIDTMNTIEESLTGTPKGEKALSKIEQLNDDEKLALSKVFDYYRTDVKGYDRFMAKKLSSTTGRKTLESYAKFIGLFKTAKIGGNLLSAGTNALVGNMVMTGMSGVNISSAEFFRSMKTAVKMIRGKDKQNLFQVFSELSSDPKWARILEESPDVFESAFGINPKIILRGRSFIDDVISNKLPKHIVDDISSQDKDTLYRLYDETIGKAMNKFGDKMGRAVRDETSVVSGRLLRNSDSMLLTGEVLSGPYQDFINKVGEMADQGIPAMGFFHKYLTVPMDMYSKIDQAYRLGLALHLTQNGISQGELLRLSRRVKIPNSAITQVTGRNLYKIDPREALLTSAEVYMNYLAMPGFVKIMRNVPILGSPFFSFMYGMGAITAQTAMYNPSFFNKTQFFLKEMEGEKSPIEKKLLESEYYNWYNKDSMVKMPFFRDNPVYMNVQNMIPYYSMNVFQPSDRSYDERFGSSVAKIIDKVPFFKTPEGQVMFDYMVQPLILSEEDPRGMFDQRLWRKGSKFPEKAGVTVRAMAESVIPPLSGYGGLAHSGLLGEEGEKYIPYVPSYRWRSLANSVRGKSSVGVPVSENPTVRTLRTLSSMSGFPVYQMKKRYNTSKK